MLLKMLFLNNAVKKLQKAGITQSVQWLATCPTFRGSKPNIGNRFCLVQSVESGSGAHPASCTMDTGFVSRGNTPPLPPHLAPCLHRPLTFEEIVAVELVALRAGPSNCHSINGVTGIFHSVFVRLRIWNAAVISLPGLLEAEDASF